MSHGDREADGSRHFTSHPKDGPPPDPLDALVHGQYPNAGWWVFHHGGLFDARWAESPPLAHIVNVGRGSATLCGMARFGDNVLAGGAWGPRLDQLGGLHPAKGEPRIAACDACMAGLPELAHLPVKDGGFTEFVRSSGV